MNLVATTFATTAQNGASLSSTVGNANSGLLFIAIALLAAGAILFVLEVFLPSGGILAILSAASLVASVVVMFMFNSMLGITLLLGYFIFIPIVLYWGLKIWKNSSVGHKLILGADTEGTNDHESQIRSEQARTGRVDQIKDQIGRQGIADSTLRPVGFVLIGNQRLDAIAEGDVIEMGQSVEVVDAYDNQIKVRAVPDQE